MSHDSIACDNGVVEIFWRLYFINVICSSDAGGELVWKDGRVS